MVLRAASGVRSDWGCRAAGAWPGLPVPLGPVWQTELPTGPLQVQAPEAVMDTLLPLREVPVLKLLSVPKTVNVPPAGVVFTVGGELGV